MKDCVSLEIAKKLKEAGWSSDGDFAYLRNELKIHGPVGVYNLVYTQGQTFKTTGGRIGTEAVVNEMLAEPLEYAAPTIGELLEAFDHENFSVSVGSDFYEEGKRIVYRGHLHRYQDFENADIEGEESPNPADALALLWMALKEKNLA